MLANVSPRDHLTKNVLSISTSRTHRLRARAVCRGRELADLLAAADGTVPGTTRAEVGAGFGTVTGDLCRSPVEHWLALKPDRATAAHLAADRQTGLL